MKKKILVQAAQEYFSDAQDAYNKEHYNSAVVLYFKTIVALVDMHILDNQHITPSSHTHRFRICQEYYPDLYDVLDKIFPFYQDSYIQKMSKELAEVLKDDALTLAQNGNVQLTRY
ncbi:MAG: hypothetical protein ACMXYK_01920 [Candidatus Woesearchaeota archaeon]